MNTDSNESTDVLEHDPASNTYHTTLEWTTHDPSIAVVELLARLLDVDPIDLEPLASSVDPAALDALLRGQRTRAPAERCTVVFTYLGHRVTVSSDGRVEIEPPNTSESGDLPADVESGERGDVGRDEKGAVSKSPETDENGGEDWHRGS